MSRFPNHPMFPDFGRVEDGLSALILVCGGATHALWADETYEPLADFFRLDQRQRSILRSEYLSDGRDEAYWHTWVQWAKDRLKKSTSLYCPRRGLWVLTDAGVRRGQRVLLSQEDRAMLTKHGYREVTPLQLKPTAEITLEDLGLD